MYKNYARQSLPAKEYLELLGAALCAFSSNNGFHTKYYQNGYS